MYIKKILIFSLTVLSFPTVSQSSLPNISPDVAAQAKSLSPSQRASLARQAGINLPEGNISNVQDDAEPTVDDRFKDFSEDDEELKTTSLSSRLDSRFGMSIFQNRVSTFSPVDNLPVPDDYKLGSGDQLIIKLLGTENIQLNPTISRDGSIFINQIGEIVLSGLLFDEAAELIKQRIESALIGVQVFVTMGRIKTINIFISGEVRKPGMYSLSALTTVTQSLYQAGGITGIGSLRNIQVIRNGTLFNSFDAYDLLIYGNASNDIRLRSGDVLFIPTYEGIVSISGSVKRKGLFEIQQSDTFRDLVKWSGGYTADANPEFGVLVRSKNIGDLPSSKSLNFKDIDNLSINLKPNDAFNIPSIGETVLNTVTVSGAVNRPGQLGWYEGMRLSDIFSNLNEDFDTANLDFNFSFIERVNPKTFKWEMLSFSPAMLINDQSSDLNIELFDGDIVNILFNDSRRESQINSAVKKLIDQNSADELTKVISISGAVKFPGQYPIFTSATLEDMFIAAGGFLDTALLGSIEISRRNLVDDGKVVPSVIEISALENLNESRTFKPQSRDRVHVRTVNELVSVDFVTLRGQVKYPGVYPLNSNDTLTSIIERAGGFLEDAFIEGAFLQRKNAIAEQKKGNSKLANTIRKAYASSMLTSEETSNSFEEINSIAQLLEEVPNDGRIVIQLKSALNGSKENDISIQAGDNLYIPRSVNTIAVIGEVNSSNSIIYSSKLDVIDYIEMAGGFTPRANKSDIYIIKASGSVVPLTKSFLGFGLTRYKPQKGDTIVVPVRASYTDTLTLWTKATQVIYQSMVSIAAIDKITD